MVTFSQLTQVEAIDSHSYKVNLHPEWCIGSVPHGGAVTSVLMAVAKRHFETTLKKQNQPDCMINHVDFVQRTSAGPAVVKIKEVKLGRQTSTVQVTLTQDSRDEILAILTHANLSAENGLSLLTSWALTPAPPAADLSRLSKTSSDGTWQYWSTPRSDFRKAALKLEIYLPRGERTARGVTEQWMRFSDGERFTNVALGLVCDMFPQITESYESDQEALAAAGITPKELVSHWYPTLALNLDVKKKLPEEGVEWLYLRLQTKVLQRGRKDLEVVIMDEEGDVVGLSQHVAMIVGIARNLAKRGEGGGNGKEKGKL